MSAPGAGGDARVFALRHGTRTTWRSEVYLNYATYGEPDGPHTVDYYFWAIEQNGRVTLIDTGFDAEVARKREREVLHDPVEMLESIFGIHTEDIDTIVVTHCHYDHIGNLARFANAHVHIAQAELDFLSSGALEHLLVGHFTEAGEISVLQDLYRRGHLTGITVDTELTPGIRLIPVGGHTPGQLMVEVDTTDGTVLLASDALHFVEELERDMPFISSMDVPATYRAFETIRARLTSGVTHLVPGHDANALDAMTRLCDDVAVIG